MTDGAVVIAGATGTPDAARVLGFDERSWDKPWNIVRGHQTMAERMPTATLAPGHPHAWTEDSTLDLASLIVHDPLLDRALPLERFLDQRLMNDGLLVVHNGRKIAERYGNGMDPQAHHVVHSCSKTLTAMLVGWAVDAGHLDVQTPVTDLVVELAGLPAWHGVTLQHLLDMAAGLDTEEHYEKPDSMYWRYAEAVGYYGSSGSEMGVLAFVEQELTHRVCEPGTVFNYASYLSNLIPIMIERASGADYLALLREHIYSRIGAESTAQINVDAFNRPIVEGQVSVTLRDFARWAYLMANDGRNLVDDQVVPSWWVDEAFAGSPERRGAFERSEYSAMFPFAEYHNQSWLLDPAQHHLALLGIHGQFAYIDRRRRLMIVGMSSFPDQANPLFTAYLREVWATVTKAVD